MVRIANLGIAFPKLIKVFGREVLVHEAALALISGMPDIEVCYESTAKIA